MRIRYEDELDLREYDPEDYDENDEEDEKVLEMRISYDSS